MTVLTRAGYALPGTSLAFKTGDWKVQKPVHHHYSAPCHSACPAGEDAQAYLAHIQSGHNQQAWETLVKVNPMPAITGRVCPHPCETACNRGAYDDAVAIHAVERFLGDQAIEKDWAYPVPVVSPKAPEIAIVGAGPAGLSAAYHLARLGYRSTIFEERTEAGGTLRTALPPYRLPRSVIDAEVERILAIQGITFKPHTRLGRDVDLRELQADFSSVFLGIGTQNNQDWSIDGAVPHDLRSGLDLLKEWVDIGTVPTPKSVAIVGAGNTAVDIARVMKRAGVSEVHIISHKPIPRQGIPASEAMPAIQREVEEALEEGVKIHEYRGIRRLILRGERLVGVELVHMKKLMQPSGKLKRVAFEGTESILNVEQVIPAIGQKVEPFGVENIIANKSYFNSDEWGKIDGQDNLYVGGDASGKAGIVSAAVGEGRRAAQAIAYKLQNKELPQEQKSETISFERLNLHYYEPHPRVQEPTLPVEQRRGDEEITDTVNSAQISKESLRCFSCGNCMACDNCWTLCPDSAILKTKDMASDGSHYVFDYEYCKGCGLCANECPCGYIDMVEDL